MSNHSRWRPLSTQRVRVPREVARLVAREPAGFLARPLLAPLADPFAAALLLVALVTRLVPCEALPFPLLAERFALALAVGRGSIGPSQNVL